MHRQITAKRRSASMRRMGASAVFGITAVLGITACQSGPSPTDNGLCAPKAGMTTDQLYGCRCFPANEGGGFSLSPEGSAAQSIVILNYLCPKGGGGMYRVVVVNGIAKDVYD